MQNNGSIGRSSAGDEIVGSRWVVNDERIRERSEVGEFLESMGAELREGEKIKIADENVGLKPQMNFTIRFEESSKSKQILLKMEWDDELNEKIGKNSNIESLNNLTD